MLRLTLSTAALRLGLGSGEVVGASGQLPEMGQKQLGMSLGFVSSSHVTCAHLKSRFLTDPTINDNLEIQASVSDDIKIQVSVEILVSTHLYF